MSAAQQACRLLNTLEYKRRQQEPAPKGFGEILGAAQNIVKDSQVQQSASWRPTEIQLQDEDYIHKQLVASPEAPSPRRSKAVRLGKGLRLASRVIRQPTRRVRWGDGGLGSPTGAASRGRGSTSGGGVSPNCNAPLKHTPAAGRGAAATAGGTDKAWEVEGVSIERSGYSSSCHAAAAAADVSTSGRDASQAAGVRLPQIHPGKPLIGAAANTTSSSSSSNSHSSTEAGVRTAFEKQQQVQGQGQAPPPQQQQQLAASSLRPQAGSPTPSAAPSADHSSIRGAGAAGHIRFGGEAAPSGRSSPAGLPQAAGGAGAHQKSPASAAGLNGDLMALYLSQPESSSSSSLHASSDAGSQQDSRGASAATDKADQQLQRLRQATTARKEAGSSEDEGEDPWTQELGYKPLAIPDSMFAKWTEASHQKPAAAATAASSGGSSSRGPSARRASVATYIPGSSLQSVGGARGAAAAGGGAPAGWSSNGHARRASIGTVYPSDDASLAAKLSSTGAAAAVAAAGGGAGLPRRQSLSSDTPQLVPTGAAAPQRAHSGHAPSLPSLSSKAAAGSLAASLRTGANAASSSTSTGTTSKAGPAARAPSAALGHRL